MDPTPPPQAAATRCRECWDATRTLLAAHPGRFAGARAALHLEGLQAGRRALGPEALEAALAGLEPGAAAVVAAALAAGAVPEADEAGSLAALEEAHRRALALVEQAPRAARARRERRWALLALGAVALAVAALGLVRLWGWWRAPPDLAAGQPWSASSSAAACQPAQGQCAGEQTRVLFYTREEPFPWYQVDLGQPRSFSWVTVRNRSDTLLERAIPLVLEVSDDARSWREVARKAESFARWEARFAPVTARYLRARVDRTSVLHLEGVELHP